MFAKNLITLAIMLSVASICFACPEEHDEEMSIMNQLDKDMGFENITEKHHTDRRRLASFRPLNIYFDMSEIESSLKRNGMSDRVQFYRKTFAIVGKWWMGALKVNDDRSEIVRQINRYRSQSSDYRFDISASRQASYDLLIKVKLCQNKGRALAYAGPRVRHPTSQRPITGTCCVLPYGDANFKKAKDSVNRGVGTIIHEFGHVISFISFDRYQRKNIQLNRSINRYEWIGPKVMAAAKNYYGCRGSFSGVPIQNLDGNIGGHWSETFLSDELMTPTTGASPEKVSPMTLALCEDSGWYQANYSYTENYSYGKGQFANKSSCKFTKSCPSPAICRSGTSGFVASNMRGIGYCAQDANGCPQERVYSNRDCMNGTQWPKEHAQYYGASYGGNCVIAEGSFVSVGGGYRRTGTQVSVQARCSNSRTSYELTFKKFGKDSRGNSTGDASVTCTRAGTVKFNTSYKYSSSVKCYDPKTFCGNRFGSIGQAKCDDTCTMNGRCQKVGNSRRELWDYDQWKCDNGRGCKSGYTKTGSKPKPKVTVRTRTSTSTSGMALCKDPVTGVARKPKTSTTPKPRTPTPRTTTPTTRTRSPPAFGTGNSGTQWKCWCYNNYRDSSACPALAEDRD